MGMGKWGVGCGKWGDEEVGWSLRARCGGKWGDGENK